MNSLNIIPQTVLHKSSIIRLPTHLLPNTRLPIIGSSSLSTITSARIPSPYLPSHYTLIHGNKLTKQPYKIHQQPPGREHQKPHASAPLPLLRGEISTISRGSRFRNRYMLSCWLRLAPCSLLVRGLRCRICAGRRFGRRG